MISLQWLAGVLFVLSVVTFSPTDASFGFGDAEHERNFLEFYSAKKMLAKCYGDGVTDDWTVFTDQIYKDCYAAENKVATPQTRKMHLKHKAFFDEDRLSDLTDELHGNIRVVQCVFDKLSLKITSSGVDAYILKRQIEKRKLAWGLRRDTLEGLETCSKKAACGDFELLGKDYVQFFRLVKFFKCYQDIRVRSCIKYDLDKGRHAFQLYGLRTFVKDKVDSERRMTIVSAFYNAGDKSGGLWNFI